MDTERLMRAVAAAHRRRTELVPGGRVIEVDGLAVQVTGLPDPSMNFCTVEREPEDPDVAVEAAEKVLSDVAMPFGIDLPVGRFRGVERAVQHRGFRPLFARPVMTASVGRLPALAPPWEAELDRVRSDEDLVAIADVDAEVFGLDPMVARGLYGPAMLEDQDVAIVLARLEGEPVGGAFAIRLDETVGVFGVAVLPAARRRGIGGALTCAAVRAVGLPDDVAWLFPDGGARPLYERLGFAAGDPWEVWAG
jgi:GNAT superfamily N-acetyltransferase